MNQTIIQTTENESYIQSTFNGLENEQIFNVLFRKSDGYINVTKLCKDGNKNYFNWKKSNHSTKLLQAFQRKYPNTELLQLIHKGKNYKISGTRNFCVEKLREFIDFNITQFNIKKFSEKKFVEKVNQVVREYEKIQEKVNKEIIRSMRVIELKNLCRERELKGYSKMKKEELLGLILDN